MKTALTAGTGAVRGVLLTGAWLTTNALAQKLPDAPAEPVTDTMPDVEVIGSVI